MQTILQIKAERNSLLTQAAEIVNTGLHTREQKAEYRTLLAKADELEENIRLLERLEQLDQSEPSVRQLPPVATAPAPAPVAAPAIISGEGSQEQRKERRNTAFRHFLRHGIQPNAPEQRDLTVSSTGEALIAEAFDSSYAFAQMNYGPIGALTKRVKGAKSTKMTAVDDTSSKMSYVPETYSVAALEAEPTLTAVIESTDSLVSLIKASYQEVQDVESIDQFINEIAGIRVFRSLEYALLTGKDNGSNTQLPNSPNGGLLGQVSAGFTQSAGQLAAGPTYAQLVALAGSVDHAYYVAPNSGFMASQSVHDFLLAQVDSTGRPLYKVDPNTGLLQIGGKPLYVASNAAMPTYNAASCPVVIFGDFSKFYSYLTDGMRVRVLTERYADTLENGYVIFHRVGAASLISGAVKALVTAAS